MSKSWSSISVNFPNERDCLASYVAWQAAEVLMGIKPANLVNINNRYLPCGRNLSKLWDKHKDAVLSESSLKLYELSVNSKRRLILFYDDNLLKNTLRNTIAQNTLEKIGYSYGTPDEALLFLSKRINESHEFPHEIGFFLGYPEKDVLGFMGISNLPISSTGPWKIYGEKSESMKVVNRYRSAKASVVHSLDSGVSPIKLLKEPSLAA